MAQTETIATKGILHFTISVRDHVKAAQYYAELLGCKIDRVSEHFAFMRSGSDHFVLARMPGHVNPNPPDGTKVHHAFMVEAKEFDHAMEVLKARGIALAEVEAALRLSHSHLKFEIIERLPVRHPVSGTV